MDNRAGFTQRQPPRWASRLLPLGSFLSQPQGTRAGCPRAARRHGAAPSRAAVRTASHPLRPVPWMPKPLTTTSCLLPALKEGSKRGVPRFHLLEQWAAEEKSQHFSTAGRAQRIHSSGQSKAVPWPAKPRDRGQSVILWKKTSSSRTAELSCDLLPGWMAKKFETKQIRCL